MNESRTVAARRTRGFGATLLALGVATLLAAGCAVDSSSSSSSGNGGTGGTATCDQGCQDEWTGFGIISIVWAQNNAYLNGQPAVTFTGRGGACATGGSVVIDGTTSVAGTTQSNNVVYTMTACGDAEVNEFDLTVTGAITQAGTFTQGGAPIQMNYTGSSIQFSGTVLDTTTVGDACDISFGEDSNGASGTICGRSFAY